MMMSVCAALLLVACGGDGSGKKATKVCMEKAKADPTFYSADCRKCCGDNGADPEVIKFDMPKDAEHPTCQCFKK